ncbi:MAG TPA: MarR family transcriptional regulator [Bacillota bacterium]|nr:MarR family transcriptional regulator [Bacillota bacterium]
MEDQRVVLQRTLIRVTSKLTKLSKSNLDHFGINGPEYSIIRNLGHEELTLSELSLRLLKVNSNITMMVDHLEAKGLVKRIPDPRDRRVIRVRLTEQGLELREAAVSEHNRYLTDLLVKVTENETEQLLSLLNKVESICDAKNG